MHIAIKLVQSPELSQFPVSVPRPHRLAEYISWTRNFNGDESRRLTWLCLSRARLLILVCQGARRYGPALDAIPAQSQLP